MSDGLSRGSLLETNRCWATLTWVMVCSLSSLAAGASSGIGLAQLWSSVPASVLVDFGGLSAPRVWLAQEWWRVASAALLHGSLLHLGLNMVALWSVGGWLERAVGPWWLSATFVASATGGSLASLAWVDGWLVVGASGGVFGLAGALLFVRLWGCEQTKSRISAVSARSLAFWLSVWLVVGAVAVLADWLPLAQGGHVGGLMSGLGVSLLWLSRRVWRRRLLVLGLFFGLVAVAVALALAAQHPVRPAERDLAMGYALLESGEPVAAADRLLSVRLSSGLDVGLDNDIAYALALGGSRLEFALELATGAVAREPDNPDFLDTMGWIRCLLGDEAGGRRTLERALTFAGSTTAVTVRGHLERCDTAGASLIVESSSVLPLPE